MQVVIEISEEMYQRVMNTYIKVIEVDKYLHCIKSGTPLPEHGRLIDADAIKYSFKKDIEWLIEQYQDEINKLEEERRTNKSIGFGDAMNCGKIGAYARVVENLKELLEDDDADN